MIFSKMLEAILPDQHKINHTEGNLECSNAVESMLIGITRTEAYGDIKPTWIIQRVVADPEKQGEYYVRKLYYDGAHTLSDSFWGYVSPLKTTIVRMSLSSLVGKIVAFWQDGGLTGDAISVATEAGVKWLQNRAATEFDGITACIRRDVMAAYREYEKGCHSCMTGNDSQFTEVYESCDRVRLVELNRDGRHYARFICVKLEEWSTWDTLPEGDDPLNPASTGWSAVRVYPFPRTDYFAEETSIKYIAQKMPWLSTYWDKVPNGGVGGVVPDSEYLPYLDRGGNFWVGQGDEFGQIVLYWGDCSPPAGQGQKWRRLSGDNHTGGNLAQPPEPEFDSACCSCDAGLCDDDVWSSPDGSPYCQSCYDERWTNDWGGFTIDLDTALTISGGVYSGCNCSRDRIPREYTEAWDFGEQCDIIALTEDCVEVGDVWYYGTTPDDIVQARCLNWNPHTQMWDVGDEEFDAIMGNTGNGYITTVHNAGQTKHYLLPTKFRASHGLVQASIHESGQIQLTVAPSYSHPEPLILKRWYGVNTGGWHWVISQSQDQLPTHAMQWRFEACDLRNFAQFAPNTESAVSNA